MEKKGEKKDHIHHRSFWFTHGDVNGISFWHENAKHGNTVHRKFVKVSGGERAVISTINDWVGPDGKKHCEDQRTYTFFVDGKNRYVDVDITVRAAFWTGDIWRYQGRIIWCPNRGYHESGFKIRWKNCYQRGAQGDRSLGQTGSMGGTIPDRWKERRLVLPF